MFLKAYNLDFLACALTLSLNNRRRSFPEGDFGSGMTTFPRIKLLATLEVSKAKPKVLSYKISTEGYIYVSSLNTMGVLVITLVSQS